MFRRYTISITTLKDAPQLPTNLSKQFGCSISEPSNWLTPGLTKERGLTFIDKQGKEMDSFMFQHLPYFNLSNPTVIKEEKEIEALIYTTLFEHYHVDASEVKVVVEEYDRI